MTLNMGPQHPSTHGVLRVALELDGETILRAKPIVGYLHTGMEKQAEYKTYTQSIPQTDRMDYISPMSNNLAFCLAVEKLLGIEPPARVQAIRVLLAELTRISSHCVWLGTHAIDIGALTVFWYTFREREKVLSIYDMVCGARMTSSYFRVGGLAMDIPEGFLDSCEKFVDEMPAHVDEYEALLTKNPIWLARTRGVAPLSRAGRHRAGRHRPGAARLGRQLGPAQERAVLGLRDLRLRGPGRHARRRVRPLPGPRRRDARVDQDREAGDPAHPRAGREGRRTACATTSTCCRRRRR